MTRGQMNNNENETITNLLPRWSGVRWSKVPKSRRLKVKGTKVDNFVSTSHPEFFFFFLVNYCMSLVNYLFSIITFFF